MYCPACPESLDSTLCTLEVQHVRLDYCPNCGGLWFDNFELQKFDEAKEPAGQLLDLHPERPDVAIDYSARRYSPRHPEIVLQRQVFSYHGEVEIDVCPLTGGIWLDHGELGRIRELYPSAEQKEKAADALAGKMVAKATELQREETLSRAAHARRFANLFRFICPSTYISGKQRGAAF